MEALEQSQTAVGDDMSPVTNNTTVLFNYRLSHYLAQMYCSCTDTLFFVTYGRKLPHVVRMLNEVKKIQQSQQEVQAKFVPLLELLFWCTQLGEK